LSEKGHYFVVPVLIEKAISVPGWLSTKLHVYMTENFKKGTKDLVKSVSEEIP
jgi:hypothetical protein